MNLSNWLQQYKPRDKASARNALREILHQVILAALYRAGFFEKAAFYGGTALRIFHGLPRFSEDLDFSLLDADDGFSFEPYFDQIRAECASIGLPVEMSTRLKAQVSPVESAFLKTMTVWNEITVPIREIPGWPNQTMSLTIKIEADTQPPLGFTTENLLLIRPFSCYIKCFSLPDLFAGKMHAVLFRKWQNRTKGRDWFDLEWYIQRNIPINLDHFSERARQDQTLISEETISKEDLLRLLEARIEQLNISQVIAEVSQFINDPLPLEIWSKQYFRDLITHIRFTPASRLHS